MEKLEWAKVDASTLADQAYRAIRERILEVDIAPGEFLREQELCEGLGVSRTPVREALGRLASEGFLERIPHRGFRVPEEPLGSLLELYPIVSTLELLAGRLALPHLGDDDIEELRHINEQLAVARTSGEIKEMILLNNQFHHVFCERSGSERLCQLLDDLRGQLNRLEYWYYSDRKRAKESVVEHDELIQAIQAGDHELALTLLERNMALTYRRLAEDRDLLDATTSPTAG